MIGKGLTVLEPSAGTGVLAKAARDGGALVGLHRDTARIGARITRAAWI